MWFTDKERALATALQTIAMPGGSACTFALNQYWFADPDADFKALFKTLMLLQVCLTAFVWVLFNLIIKAKPDSPPSAVAEVPYEALDFKQSFKALS